MPIGGMAEELRSRAARMESRLPAAGRQLAVGRLRRGWITGALQLPGLFLELVLLAPLPSAPTLAA